MSEILYLILKATKNNDRLLPTVYVPYWLKMALVDELEGKFRHGYMETVYDGIQYKVLILNGVIFSSRLARLQNKKEYLCLGIRP